MKSYPNKSSEEIIHITNQIVMMVSEFHMTSYCWPIKQCRPVVPPFMEDDMPPEEEYLAEGE